MKKTKILIASLFLISIMGIVSTVSACGHRRVLFMAIGDDLDLNATDLIVGNIKNGKGGAPPSVKAIFHQRIYDDETGKKVYTMTGMLKGSLVDTHYVFYCPVYNYWFINVSFFMGEGKYRTSDTELSLTYRNWFPITMPNTEGKYVSAPMIMLLSTTGEYYKPDPSNPLNPESIPWDEEPKILEHRWVLTGVLCGIWIGPDTQLPIGPVSNLTRYIEI